jgi:hypothetical protein
MKINIKNSILIINFVGNKQKMNNVLDPISNIYEGVIINREGHNFPSSYIPENHVLAKYKKQCKYVIGIYNNKSLCHEMLHAKYYTDVEYKQKIDIEWNELPSSTKNYLIHFLKKLGYDDKVIIDEYQAYRYSEPSNFFGIIL